MNNEIELKPIDWNPDHKFIDYNEIELKPIDWSPDYAAMFDSETYINLMFNIVKHYVPHFEWKPFTFEKGPGCLCIEGKAYGLWD